MNSLSFYTTKELTKSDLMEIGRTILNVSEIKWSDASIDKISGSSSGLTAYIETYSRTGQFHYQYEIYLLNISEAVTKRKEVDVLVRLAREYDLEALTASEEIDPYTFIHVLPDGQVHSVDVTEDYDEKDELTVRGIYNLPFGGFGTETILSDSEKQVMDTLLQPILKECECVQYHVDIMNNDFTHNRGKFDTLRKYNHIYFVRPVGPGPWWSKDEKSELIIKIMTSFNIQTQKKVCVFPSNATRYQNIPGGSDHESFCINIVDGREEKVVYKVLRERW